MFDPEFFPTPAAVIEQMGIDCHGKICLEPSAGKGNIIEWLNNNGARQVIACERNEQLRRILSGQCELLAPDFFTVSAEQVSHAITAL